MLPRLALDAMSPPEPTSLLVESALLLLLDLGAGRGLVSTGDGLTNNALPWRPVKPLLMIWLERAREALQRAQESWLVWPESKEGLRGLEDPKGEGEG